ncbi:MAG: hypothetical protein AAB405_01765 [Patescibacteria group bacterium]
MNNIEIIVCQNCKQNFKIKPEDFEFYAKTKVPAPTWCPGCRFIRKMIFINERKLYKRKDSWSGDDIIALFPPETSFPVYDYKIWWSDKWDPMTYGREYDFSKSFFQQLKEISDVFPKSNLHNIESVNCLYCPLVAWSRNCYYTTGFNAENCMYGHYTRNVKDAVDYFFLIDSEFCYECINCSHCYNVKFSQYAVECIDSSFLYDCKNCSNCFGCVGLRNKQYYIFNKPYSKEEYKKKTEEYFLGSFKTVQEIFQKFQQFKMDFPRRYAVIYNAINTTGNNITNAKNCHNCFEIDSLKSTIENCKNIIIATATKDSYDMIDTGEESQLCYESCIVIGYKILFSKNIVEGRNVQYSFDCKNSSDLFGCFGLRNKQYCIFNKQYTKEEYEKLVPMIIQHMNNMPYTDKQGSIYKYGEFFPLELSSFCYNETMAEESFLLTKEQAINKGYVWKDSEERNIQITLKSEDLPDHIKDVNDSITNETIECQHNSHPPAGGCNEQCTQAFKIIQPELDFYRKMNLPLPRLCPNCRHYQRLKQRNPLKLWKRQCQCQGIEGKNPNNTNIYQNTINHFHNQDHCPNEFETTYSPERPEIVYCEKCYQAEII